ncbi:MAG: cytochrome c biogenesis CcdA family protein [Promethearchaeota archaeon]
MEEVNILITFLSGLAVGITPCILLMLSVFGTSVVLIEEKNKFLIISIGLITGMVLAYILVSILFLPLIEELIFISFIFAGILIFLGLWQIVECKKEQSLIFGTPEKVKTVLNSFIQKNSGFYAFLVGIIFVLIKIPCFGGIYLSILANLYANPLLYVFIFIYIIGMLLPIIVILILIRLGLESSKINDFRIKHRTKLRLLNGAILVFLAIYLLINQIVLIYF